MAPVLSILSCQFLSTLYFYLFSHPILFVVSHLSPSSVILICQFIASAIKDLKCVEVDEDGNFLRRKIPQSESPNLKGYQTEQTKDSPVVPQRQKRKRREKKGKKGRVVVNKANGQIE